MRSVLKVTILIGLCFLGLYAHAADLPRMWKIKRQTVTGETQTFHILGASHNGLDFEYDAYFFDKVLPIFDRSSMLFSESALMIPNQVPQCTLPLEQNDENRQLLSAMRAKLETQYFDDLVRDFKFEGFTNEQTVEVREAFKLMAKMRVESLSEYGLLLALMQVNPNPPAEALRSRTDVLSFLKVRSKEIPRASVDTPEEMISAFCSLKADRAKYIREQVKSFTVPDWDAAEVQAFERARKELLSSFVTGNLSSYFNQGLEFEEAYVCERNRNWLKLILSSKLGDQSFFVLGFAHVMSADWRPKNCPDFLTMLKNEAFTVELVP